MGKILPVSANSSCLPHLSYLPHLPLSSGLVRGFGKWDLLALVLNAIIGAGIFGLPSTVFALAGTYSILAYLVCAVPVALVILCFAEVGSRFRETGGPYLYARVAFGPFVGFEVGWLMWLARVTAFAALCNLFVGYLGYFLPGLDSGPGRTLAISGVVVFLTTANVVGVRTTATVTNVFTIGKLIPLLLLVAVGLFFINPDSYSFAARPSYGSFSTAVLLLVFAYTGFEAAIVPTGEMRDPGRHIPFALLTGTVIVVVLYVLIQTVCIGTLPQLAGSDRPLSDAILRFLGPPGAAFVAAGALLSVSGTMNGTVLATSRLLFALAEQRQLPRFLTATHRRFRTPHVAILISACVMLGLTLFTTFVSAVSISTVIRLLTYAATCAALPVLRRNSWAPRAAFTAPGGSIVALAALAFTAWLLSNSTWGDARVVAVVSMAGALLYALYALRRAPRPEEGVASVVKL
jgi:amino acid transporter